MMIKIAVLCNNNLLCEGLKQCLKDDREIAVINRFDDSLEDVLDLSPHVILMDACCIQDILPQLKNTTIKVLIFNTADSNQEQKNNYFFLLKNVAGVISKNTSLSLLRKAIITVYNGEEVWIGRKGMKKLIDKMQSTFNDLKHEKLTKRENEIAMLIAQGHKNKVIAKKLFISEQTVKSHINRIYKKLGINNRVNLAIHYNRSKNTFQ